MQAGDKDHVAAQDFGCLGLFLNSWICKIGMEILQRLTFISDLKVECRCRTVQSKSSSSLFFCYWNGFSILAGTALISCSPDQLYASECLFPKITVHAMSTKSPSPLLACGKCQWQHFHPLKLRSLCCPVSHYVCADIPCVYLPRSCPAGHFYSNSPQQCSLQVQSQCLW